MRVRGFPGGRRSGGGSRGFKMNEGGKLDERALICMARDSGGGDLWSLHLGWWIAYLTEVRKLQVVLLSRIGS